ncbi:MAG TPA: DUF1232 domain-containing protein [Actinomycetota bacterium]
MTDWVVALLVALAVCAVVVLWLVLTGRRVAARELVALVPNLALLFRDLVRDPTVPRGPKVWLVLGGLWIASPIDLLPEFLPVIGPLDDAIVAAIVLRHLARRAGLDAIRRCWRGDPATLDRILRAARIG